MQCLVALDVNDLIQSKMYMVFDYSFFLATSRRELCITITIHHSCCTTRLPVRHVHGTVDIFEFNDKGGPPNSIMLHLPFTCIHIVLTWVIHMYFQGVMRGRRVEKSYL